MKHITRGQEDLSEYRFQRWRKKPVMIRAAYMNEPFEVETLEGTMRGNAGDYLICGVQGELYPCRNDIFHATYEFADWNPHRAEQIEEG